MTATQRQIRRDTDANLILATPASGEMAGNTTKNRIHYGDGSRAGGWALPNFSDLQLQAFNSGSVGGTGNAITITNPVPLLAYAQYAKFTFKASAGNTGATTVNIDGLGTKNIYKMADGVLGALESGDIVSGGIYEITYDGTQFQIKALDEGRGSDAGLILLATVSGGGASYDFTGVFTSDYNNYVFMLENLLPATFGSFRMRVRRSGQGSFDSSGYTWTSQAGTANGTDSSMNLHSDANHSGISGFVNGYGFNGSGQKVFNGLLTACRNDSANPNTVTSTFGGSRVTTTALDGAQFFFSSGNISSGAIRLYGMRASL